MMRAGKISVETLVVLAAFAVFLVLMITFVMPPVLEAFTGKRGVCEWNLVVHSLLRVGGLAGIPAECRAERVTITKKDLDKHTSEAYKRIQTYWKEKKYAVKDPVTGTGIRDHFKGTEQKQLYEWALDKIVAEHMRKCWNKVSHGKLPMFDQWWNWIDITLFGAIHQQKQTAARVREGVITQWNAGPIDIYGPPTVCIVCSRVKFDKEVKDLFPLGINSLTPWLKNNPLPRDTTSYYEFLLDGQTFERALMAPQYPFRVTEPYAVLYSRTNIHKLTETVKSAISFFWTGEDVPDHADNLRLVPYNKVIKPRKDDPEAGNCAVVID